MREKVPLHKSNPTWQTVIPERCSKMVLLLFNRVKNASVDILNYYHDLLINPKNHIIEQTISYTTLLIQIMVTLVLQNCLSNNQEVEFLQTPFGSDRGI